MAVGALVVCLVAACGPGVDDEGTNRSPQVAFMSDRGGDYDVYVIDLETDSVVNLTAHPAFEWGFTWSPDGERIAFGSDRDGNPEIYALELETGAVVRLTDDEARDGAPAWSPDGTRIAFVSRRDSESGDLYTMASDGSDVRRVTDNDRYEEVPAWSPDGESLVFGALAPAADGAEPTLQIFRLDLETGAETQLTFLPGHNSAPRWSPDGSRIAFYGQVGEGFDGADIMTVAPDGSGLTNLTNDAEPDWQPDWSPDGEWIVFARGPGEPLDLWMMRADGTERRIFVTNDGRDEQPKWRPE